MRTDAAVWTRPEQFELMVSLVATISQDLFRAGRLHSTAIDSGSRVAAKRLADLESFLDRLAQVRTAPAPMAPYAPPAYPTRTRLNVMTFEPEGTRGVAAIVNGIKTAAT
jgi:hypothetical protein